MTSAKAKSGRLIGVRAGATVAATLLICSCGAKPTPTTADHMPRPTTAAAGQTAGKPTATSNVIHVRYESVGSGGDSAGATMLVDDLIDGVRVRTTVRDKSDPSRVVSVMVWDGHTLLYTEPGAGPPSRVEDPPADQRPEPAFMHPGDTAFTHVCPGGKPAGHATVAGRPGTTYTCPAHTVAGEPAEKTQLALDDATGLMLRWLGGGHHDVALEVTVGVPTDSTTFSTDLPASAQRSPGPLTAVASVPKVGGGTLLMADLRKGPSLIVIGELRGLKAMLRVVLPATGNGTHPHVYGLLNAIPGPNWKGSLLNPKDVTRFDAETSAQVGTMPVPVGIDIKGGAAGEELRSFDQIMAGTTVLAAINADGSLAWRMTDAELSNTPRKLTDWIANNP
ncbi:hypothetical protein [Nostocoides sp. HKS02]|uniref:hypothetical protein n=1 Tax=Nostocoides sp. HKS02 TaxID=1813880 RepID=UPI0012B4F46E|nr:hypothetical protein [Tetrasphaera sp. HKS02]QGN58886.1 hypothetical protein GKE56_14445 [Tetrasphaera sp. HKS02]